MIQNLFAAQIWKSSLNLENSIKEKILCDIEENFERNKSYLYPNWNCKIHTSLFEKYDIDYSTLIPYFKDEYKKFSEQINLKPHKYIIPETWYNYYLDGYNQEYHDHVSQTNLDLYSMVYFLKLNDYHPKITFYNYTNYHVFYSSKPQIKQIYRSNDINHSIVSMHCTLDVNEGDLIIFPSWIPHGVFVQKNNDPRITISSNLILHQTQD